MFKSLSPIDVALIKKIGGTSGSITVDSVLSDTSTNPVQNKVIKSALDSLSEEIENIPSGKEQLTGTTDELTPMQVYNAVSSGIPVKVQHTDSTYGIVSFTAFAVAESLNVIASNMIAYYNGLYMLCELWGYKSNNAWGFNVTTLAQKTDIPSALPNPNALTFTGAVTGSYDGSNAKTVNIPSAVTDDHINSLIDAKLGVIENGSY